MSENFGRQKSSRWVRASIPTYGDDWGNEYDYEEYESNEECSLKSDGQDENEANNIDFKEESEEKLKKDDDEKPKQLEPLQNRNPSNLVLSIDHFKDNDSFDSSSDDDDDDDDDMPELMDDGRYQRVLGKDKDPSEFEFNKNQEDISSFKSTDGAPETQYIIQNSREDFFPPPTPTFSQGDHTFSETPTSDRSFQSDADSIQNEPENLNIIHPDKFNPTTNDNESVSKKIEWESNELNTNSMTETEDENVINEHTTDKHKSTNEADNKTLNDNTNLEEEKELNLSYIKPDVSVPKEINTVKTDALDSLINDLQNASINYDTTEGDNDISFDHGSIPQDIESENNESINFIKENGISIENQPINTVQTHESEFHETFSIEPLTINDEKELHENYINELSGHKRSVRKPPPSRQNLVSIDYSNIADAVSGYMNDQASSIKEFNHRQLSTSGSLITTQDSIDSKEDNTPQESFVEDTSSSQTSNPKFSPPQIQHRNFNANNDVNRRGSTASTNTFNLGAWQPNTNNFRDKFINDNDNESNINFNPYGDTNSTYNNFTKLDTLNETSDNESQKSSTSIPDTIDLELPGAPEYIDEDIDEETESYADDELTNVSTEPADSIVDSLGGDGLILKEVEQKRIPSQKVSSLLSPLEKKPTQTEDKYTTERRRYISNSSETSESLKPVLTRENTQQISKPTFKKISYPVFNWKSIMATSQPKDRIKLLHEALEKEYSYDTGLQNWINETLKQSENSSNIHIGKIATQAYQNAPHIDIRRHGSIRSKVSIVKDKVETSGLQASNLSKRFFSRGKKFMKSSGTE